MNGVTLPIKISITLGLDNNKKVNVVTTQKILEFLGDLGGFKEAVNIIFSLFALYVSNRLFKADLIKNLIKEEIVKEENIDENFDLSSVHVIFEPIIATFVSAFSFFECCKNCKISTN